MWILRRCLIKSQKLPYNKIIPNRLYRVICKATEKDSSKRFQTAREFKEAIIAALNRKDSSNFTIWIEHHKLIAILILVLAAISIVITFFINVPLKSGRAL